jgi:hypothetical protein
LDKTQGASRDPMTFEAPTTETSQSSVAIASDLRDNLIIDRYDPVFADMRAPKIKHLRSANSEHAVTWNVFRTLRRIAPPALAADTLVQGISTTGRPAQHFGHCKALDKY